MITSLLTKHGCKYFLFLPLTIFCGIYSYDFDFACCVLFIILHGVLCLINIGFLKIVMYVYLAVLLNYMSLFVLSVIELLLNLV